MNSGIIVLGAGGHAKVCIELLRDMGEEIAYCIGGPDSPPSCMEVPVLLGDENLGPLRSKGYSRLFVAVGSNGLRDSLASKALGLGYELVNAVSARAAVSPSARLGKGVAVMAGAVINADAVIDDLAVINTGAVIDHDCRIGRAVHVAPQSALAGRVTVGPFSLLGIGCKVVSGIEIGEKATVGAGAVVIRAVAPGARVVGTPARAIAKGSTRRD